MHALSAAERTLITNLTDLRCSTDFALANLVDGERYADMQRDLEERISHLEHTIETDPRIDLPSFRGLLDALLHCRDTLLQRSGTGYESSYDEQGFFDQGLFAFSALESLKRALVALRNRYEDAGTVIDIAEQYNRSKESVRFLDGIRDTFVRRVGKTSDEPDVSAVRLKVEMQLAHIRQKLHSSLPH